MNQPVVRRVPFQTLPHQPGVFLNYLDGDPRALPFFRHRPSFPALVEAAGEALQRSFPRKEMAHILRAQNEAFGSSDAVRRAIEDLEKPDAVAIVTGQQVGLFTGPVLTIYKALTALRLSRELRQKGLNAVPIFWMASDDHDLAEITRIAVPAPDGNMERRDAREPLFGKAAVPPFPVGTIRLPESIEQVVKAYTSSLAGLEWANTVEDLLSSCYQPGSTFAMAFGRLMARFLAGRGLILFDPRDVEAKRLAAPVILKALQEARTLRTELADRSRSLQNAGMPVQVAVLPHSSLVFFEDRDARRLLLTRDGGFVLKDTDQRFSFAELSSLAHTEPERFSPNVLLRPVVQDHLFPTVAYVGGPAEVSYFAQLEPLYRFYGRPMPVIWPRGSFTVLDQEVCRRLELHDLHPEDCFRGAREVMIEMLESSRPGFETALAGLRERAIRGLADLKPDLAALDPTLGPAADTVQRKLLHRITSLRTRFVNFELQRNDAVTREVRSLMNDCYPNGALQERELGAPRLFARYGSSLFDTVDEHIRLDDFAHLVLCR